MLLGPLESVLNRNIASSGAAREACRRLDGKTLAVKIAADPATPLLSLYFSCNEQHMSIATQSDSEPAAELQGSPLAYLSMLGRKPENALRSGSVRIQGDAEVAQAFRDLMQAAQPDFEEELARVLGDVPAHQVGKLVRGALGFGKRVASTFAQNVAEYLQEESRDVVTKIEVDDFSASVDQLRDAVERAEARVNRIQQLLRRH